MSARHSAVDIRGFRPAHRRAAASERKPAVVRSGRGSF
jgi:hypothetical protein